MHADWKCPAFGGEKIYFNRHGWNHLLRKGRLMRSEAEQKRRITLLHLAPEIITSVLKTEDYKENIQHGQVAYFWSLRSVYNNTKVRIVIRMINNGSKHFFSIMDE